MSPTAGWQSSSLGGITSGEICEKEERDGWLKALFLSPPLLSLCWPTEVKALPMGEVCGGWVSDSTCLMLRCFSGGLLLGRPPSLFSEFELERDLLPPWCLRFWGDFLTSVKALRLPSPSCVEPGGEKDLWFSSRP